MAEKFQVFVTDYIKDDLAPEKEVFGGLAEVTALDACDEEQLAGRIEEADAILLYHQLRLTRKTIARLGRCKVIVRCGVGCDNVDHLFAAECGIPVANVPDYGTEEVADSAIGLMLALTRGLALANSRLRQGPGVWSHELVQPLARLRGRVFAVVGLGRIGTAAALRAKALGMDVAFYDPYKPDGYDKSLGVRRAETLRELLQQAFVLSLHCPLTAETRRMIDGPAIAAMPRGSYLINTARGAVLDTAVLPGAVASGQLAGAAVDVLPQEPPPEDDPLVAAWRNPNHPAYHRVILNPHIAFYSEEGLKDMRIKGAQTCRSALLGRPIANQVNQVSPERCR